MEKQAVPLKSRACTECKRHKVRCDQEPGQESCARCRKHGYRCVSSSRLERIIDDDTDWKKGTNVTIIQLQNAVSELLQRNGLPPLSNFQAQSPMVEDASEDRQSLSSPIKDSIDVKVRDYSEQEAPTEQELVSAPIRSLFEVARPTSTRNVSGASSSTNPENDLIARGALPLHIAKELFNRFDTTMNHFLWGGVALVHHDLTTLRRSSSLLCAAIMAVAALHVPQGDDVFEICYSAFVNLVSRSILHRDHSLDDIRALCIGAFWLSDLSWKLSGLAVRIATESNLHQAFHKLQRGESGQYERAQLWYLLYICDHHFSIAYGRPPVIHDSHAIKSYEIYLQYPAAGPSDTRLAAQVALFIILTSAYHTFGSDSKVCLTEDDFATLRAYGLEVESWRMKWQSRLAPSPYVGSYPSKGVVLHYHFAKLQLNSLALRAVNPDIPLSLDRREAANSAISSAMSTMNLVLHEPDIRKAIVGVPLFKHTMIAFSAVFLLKVAWNWTSASLTIDKRQVLELVEAVIELMSSAAASRRHLCHHIANGLTKMIARLKRKPQVPGVRRDGGGTGAAGAMHISAIMDDHPYSDFVGETIPDAFGFEDDWMFAEALDPLGFTLT